MKKKDKQSAWQRGMEIDDEEHYLKVAEQFAKELLTELTPDELAIVAATNIMLADQLQASKKEAVAVRRLQNEISVLRETRLEVRCEMLEELYKKMDSELDSSIPIETAIALQKGALRRFRRDKWGKGGKARAQKYYDKDGAIEAWRTQGDGYSSPRAFARQNYLKYGAADYETVYRWILSYRKQNSDNM